MNALHKAEAAAREAVAQFGDVSELVPQRVLRNLLAALDAARGEAVAWRWPNGRWEDGAPSAHDTIGAAKHGIALEFAYAAPPAAPRVERYGDGVLVHWPEGVEQYIGVGDCVTGKLAPPATPVANACTGGCLHLREGQPVRHADCAKLGCLRLAPPAALAVPLTPDVLLDMAEPLRPLLHTPEHWRMVREYGGAVAAAALAQQPAAAVPEAMNTEEAWRRGFTLQQMIGWNRCREAMLAAARKGE